MLGLKIERKKYIYLLILQSCFKKFWNLKLQSIINCCVVSLIVVRNHTSEKDAQTNKFDSIKY